MTNNKYRFRDKHKYYLCITENSYDLHLLHCDTYVDFYKAMKRLEWEFSSIIPMGKFYKRISDGEDVMIDAKRCLVCNNYTVSRSVYCCTSCKKEDSVKKKQQYALEKKRLVQPNFSATRSCFVCGAGLGDKPKGERYCSIRCKELNSLHRSGAIKEVRNPTINCKAKSLGKLTVGDLLNEYGDIE